MKRLFLIFALFIPLLINAQTIKADVLVIGNGNGTLAAGYQSFKSGVKTIILCPSGQFDLVAAPEQPENIKLLYKNIQQQKLKYLASLNNPAKTKADKKAKKGKVDSTEYFQLFENTPFTEVKRSGNGWELKISNDKSIKAKVLVVTDPKIITALKIDGVKPAETTGINYKGNLYRTSLSGINGSVNFLSLYNLLIPNQENLIYIPADQLQIGAAAGATAAFGVFLQVKTSESNLKRIQGELLSFKHPLMPFYDVKPTDSNWLAIQKVGVTGILKAEIKDDKLCFNPDKEVSYDEIKQPIKDYYYKAQIWFDDHKNTPIDLENTILMVGYVGNTSVEATKTELQKKWNKNYKFSSKYDLKKILTRREFAVIINDCLKPFDQVNVDKTGRVIR